MVNLESFRRPNVEQSSEFEGIDYLHSPRSEQEFQKDLDALLREYLRAPSSYTAYLTEEGEIVDHAGNKLADMVEEAVKKRIGQKGYERTWAETAGVFALQALYGLSTEQDLVVLASPPGSEDEGFAKDGQKMSMTGISLIKNLPDGRKMITTYTVPLPEIAIDDHIKILQKVVDKQVFETVVGLDYGDYPDRHLVSRPIRIIGGRDVKAEDTLAEALGYTNFDALEKKVKLALELEGDENSQMRRVGLTSFIAKQIISYRNKQDEDGLRIVGKVTKMVFALEASGEYHSWDLWRMIDEFKGIVKGFRLQEQPKQEINWKEDDQMALNMVAALHERILNNKSAQTILSGSSCGSSGEWQDMFKNDWRDMNDFSKQNILGDILEKKNDESYSFDRTGKCVVCKTDPTQIGPCGICEECDRKIQAQAE